MADNARAADSGRPEPYSAEDVEALRSAVDAAARAARLAGCPIDDLVSPHVGTTQREAPR